MGLTSVKLQVRNIFNPSKRVDGEFLVDSGSLYTVLPTKMVKELGLKPTGQERFSLVDGTVIYRNTSNALMNFEGNEVGTRVVLGENHDQALVGVITLESMGLIFDPFKRELRKMKLRM